MMGDPDPPPPGEGSLTVVGRVFCDITGVLSKGFVLECFHHKFIPCLTRMFLSSGHRPQKLGRVVTGEELEKTCGTFDSYKRISREQGHI